MRLTREDIKVIAKKHGIKKPMLKSDYTEGLYDFVCEIALHTEAVDSERHFKVVLEADKQISYLDKKLNELIKQNEEALMKQQELMYEEIESAKKQTLSHFRKLRNRKEQERLSKRGKGTITTDELSKVINDVK